LLNKLRGTRIVWGLTGLLTVVASFFGVINPHIYDGLVAAKYLPGTISQDFIALIAGILLFIIALIIKERSIALQIIGLGIVGFLFYAYGIYTIEQIYNFLYFVYMAIFSLSFYAILYSLLNLKKDVCANAEVSNAIRKTSVGFSFLIPLVFMPLWISMLIPLLISGQRIENTYGVFIMDLCFIMPAFIILAVMLMKKNGYGVLLTPALFVLGVTLLFPVGMAEPVKLIYAMDIPFDAGSLLMYCGISMIFLVLSVIYIKKLNSNYTK